MDIANLDAFIGRTEENSGSISAHAASLIHATLDHLGASPIERDPLLHLWHWCAFPPAVPNEDLAEDGHPALGSFLPPLNLRRRMWAGGHLSFHAPLRVGAPITRHSRIERIEQKGSVSHPMAFVTVRHDLHGPDGLAVRERQDIVYLDIPESFGPPRAQPMPMAADLRKQVEVTAATLFRFSAITFNAHRIHYDLSYTQDVEHYPGLVIHGPYQAMQLMQLAEGRRGRAPDHFTFRGVHPMFLGAPLDLAAEEDGDGGLRLATGQRGTKGTIAGAHWDPCP